MVSTSSSSSPGSPRRAPLPAECRWPGMPARLSPGPVPGRFPQSSTLRRPGTRGLESEGEKVEAGRVAWVVYLRHLYRRWIRWRSRWWDLHVSTGKKLSAWTSFMSFKTNSCRSVLFILFIYLDPWEITLSVSTLFYDFLVFSNIFTEDSSSAFYPFFYGFLGFSSGVNSHLLILWLMPLVFLIVLSILAFSISSLTCCIHGVAVIRFCVYVRHFMASLVSRK